MKLLERALWASRLAILVAVVLSVLVAFATLYTAAVDALYLVGSLVLYAAPSLGEDARAVLRTETVSTVVNVIDGFLLAAILLIFALGLYELFVGRIEAVERSEFASRLLLIRSLDDLKDRLAKVVMLILVVKFFQQALRLKYETPLDLLYLALGTALVGGAVYLTGTPKSTERYSEPPSHPQAPGR